MSLNTWLAFLLASLLISISPGAGAVATMTAGLRYGLLRSYWTILGLQLGLLFQIAVVGFGIGALIARSEVIFQITKWFGVAYLIWLGIQCWRSRDSQISDDKSKGGNGFTQTLRAFVVNITNPKSYLFMVAVLPQFLDPVRSVLLQFAVMAATVVFVDFVVMNGYSLFSSQMARFLKSEAHRRRLNQSFGALFCAAALVLAFIQRHG